MFNQEIPLARFLKITVERVSRIGDLANNRGVKLRMLKMLLVLILITIGTSAASMNFVANGASVPPNDSQSRLLSDFAKMDPIDSHTHVYKDDSTFNAFLKSLNLHIVDIAVMDDRYPFPHGLESHLHDMLGVVHGSGGHASLCTTFSPYPFEEPGFAQRAIRQLNENFSEGAVAVKIYKTIGMEIKTKSGKYLMPDDPVFQPIYQDIAAHNRTVIAHIAEPTSCWQPPNPASPDYWYYQHYPKDYAYLHPAWPSKEVILAARDHMLAENPNLRVVGAHLGSMELDVNDIAQHFDRYPNFAVDTAARVPYLMLQPREKVRAFIIKYQDRILYGTDLGLDPKSNTATTLKAWKTTYARDWKYFATDETMQYKGRTVKGLALPPSVLRRLYHDNAIKWFPGIMSSN